MAPAKKNIFIVSSVRSLRVRTGRKKNRMKREWQPCLLNTVHCATLLFSVSLQNRPAHSLCFAVGLYDADFGFGQSTRDRSWNTQRSRWCSNITAPIPTHPHPDNRQKKVQSHYQSKANGKVEKWVRQFSWVSYIQKKKKKRKPSQWWRI